MGYAPPCYVDTYKRNISGHKDEICYCSTGWPVLFLEWNRLVIRQNRLTLGKSNSSNFSMGKGLLGPSGGSGGLIGGRFGKRCGGNGRRGGSMSGVGEGKVNSIGRMGSGLLAICLMMSAEVVEV
ncbi:hypothetical protein Tco_1162364 [Tanacetum coccineum]